MPRAARDGLRCIDAPTGRCQVLPASLSPRQGLCDERRSMREQKRGRGLKGIALWIGARQDVPVWSNDEGKCKGMRPGGVGSSVGNLEIIMSRCSRQYKGSGLILLEGTLRIERRIFLL